MGSALKCRIKQAASRRSPLSRRKHVARARDEALPILERPELACCVNQDVGIAADAKPAPGTREFRRREESVPKIGFGNRTEACHCSAAPETSDLDAIKVCGMDKAPASIDGGMIEEPSHGP